MTFDNLCPTCNGVTDCDEAHDGTETRCPHCGAELIAVEWDDDTISLVVRED